MAEINLLDLYPKSNRPIDERGRIISDKIVKIARQYGQEFFDGDRLYGYGGYRYDGRWAPIANRIKEHYNLADDTSILDVGSGKGFMLHDFKELMPNATLRGIDISQYAIKHTMDSVKDICTVADCKQLPFEDNSFDLVISINTVHNLIPEECTQSIKEIERVSKKHAFITVDAWRNEIEKERLLKWILTAQTFMSTDDWKEFFDNAGYTGDFYWFIP